MPAPKRRWGYYVLPILYGDDLVARLDPKLDRTTMTLEIKGFWNEHHAVQFADVLALGFIRFAKFVDAKNMNLTGIRPLSLRKHVQAVVRKNL